MLKSFTIGIILATNIWAQEICPPQFLDALFFDEKIELTWHQPSDWGDLLYDVCFDTCGIPDGLTVENDDEPGMGGWFRDSDSAFVCGSVMYPCDDGGSDSWSAVAVYTDADTTSINSRLITSPIDLSSYTSAHIEFIETYSWAVDYNDSNMVEVSIDGGDTWEVVYVSNAQEVDTDVWFVSVDISGFAGNEVLVAFRYYDASGYGEVWYVDDIQVWGSDSAEDQCGTFANYNIYMDGALIGTSTEESFVAEGLENGTEYCFEVSAVYDEGESVNSAGVCSTPMGPFQVNPLLLNFDAAELGVYQELTVTIENFDTLSHEFNISSVELANVDAALNVLEDEFDTQYATFTDPSAGAFGFGLWIIGDSSDASSTYLVYKNPSDGGQFAFINDDAIGDGGDPTDGWLISDEITITGYYPAFLVCDIFFPNPDGLCSSGELYSDDLIIYTSVDDGNTWDVLDSNMSTGWEWAGYMYNLEPNIGDATTFKVAFNYHDCGGNWGYGVGVDNVAIKEGDDFTWLSVSPYYGVATSNGGLNDSITVTVGVIGTSVMETTTEDILVTSGELELTIQVGVGVEVKVDESGLTPFEFALHQNYPNPFNPETNIQIDVAEASDVTISIFNIMGQKVATLINGKMDAGSYTIKWNGMTHSGEQLPTGMYFYEMKSSSFHAVKKLVLVK